MSLCRFQCNFCFFDHGADWVCIKQINWRQQALWHAMSLETTIIYKKKNNCKILVTTLLYPPNEFHFLQSLLLCRNENFLYTTVALGHNSGNVNLQPTLSCFWYRTIYCVQTFVNLLELNKYSPRSDGSIIFSFTLI